jgi:hypothetical protein
VELLDLTFALRVCGKQGANVKSAPLVVFASLVALGLAHTAVRAERLPPSPFTTTLSNTTPLVFGMSVTAAEGALGQPLTYVSGKPGNEIFLVIRNVSGSRWSYRDDPLYLQFRRGRLTGWKADWSRRWMWR